MIVEEKSMYYAITVSHGKESNCYRHGGCHTKMVEIDKNLEIENRGPHLSE